MIAMLRASHLPRRMPKRASLAALIAGACLLIAAGVASAAPVTDVLGIADTTAAPGGSLRYIVVVSNIGDQASPDSDNDGIADTPRVLTIALPSGLTASSARGFASWECTGDGPGPDPERVVGASLLTCTNPYVADPHSSGTRNTELWIDTNVGSLASGTLLTHLNVVGGGAAPAGTVVATAASLTPPGFGLASFDGQTNDAAGGPFTQAGGTPYEVSTDIHFNTLDSLDPNRGDFWPVEPVKDVHVDLPAGFIGNGNATSGVRCTLSELAAAQNSIPRSTCPTGSQVGVIRVYDFNGSIPNNPAPVYLMDPPVGVPVSLGFNAEGTTVTMNAQLRSGSDYGVSVEVHDVSEGLPIGATDLTLWGDPQDPSHNPERACPGELTPGYGGPSCTTDLPQRVFLRNPTACTAPGVGLETTISTDSWTNPGDFKSASFVSHNPPSFPSPSSEWGAPLGITGCADVPFDPSIEVQPTTTAAESSSGLNISLRVPQNWESPGTIATSDLKDTTLALPVGYTINPSAGSGLGVCTPQQLQAETASTPEGVGCPPEAKIGTVEVETPVLAEKLLGSIYVAKPFDNPFNSLLGLYVVVKNPERGLLIKLAGHIEPNPVTGQLVTTFLDNPQVPFSRFTLKLRQGATSPLVSPPVCGSYTAEADMTPWSEPSVSQHRSTSFAVEKGIGGGPCPAGGIPPFNPSLVAGTLNNNAGSYSPLDIHITRNDGEQEITRFSAALPSGLTAKLAGIPFCPDADIEAAKQVSGAQEEAQPSCPAASSIGHSLVGAGVGSVLAWTPGGVYMAGPYNGAPFSIVDITSAKVGPFDLGTVVVREALKIDPVTANVTVDAAASDPIPHIIDGIVIHVRDIRVHVDRPEFMINPTSCSPKSFAATVDGAGADPSNPAGQVPVTINNSFQLANCQNLAFKPGFKVSTSGKTSRANGASLSVKLTYPNAPQGTQTNLARVKVDLPKQLPSRLTTLQKACPDAVFAANPASCPAASIVGHAQAITPILPVPLTGPAYFVSNGAAKFPELVVVLQGYGVRLDLHGETFISKSGITSSTFAAVPDDPIGSFELTLPGGRYSALAANGNLCTGKLAMPTEFVAQNGASIHQSTPIEVTGCSGAIALISHRIQGRKLILAVSVPAAGRLTASARGLSKVSKRSTGRSTLKLVLSRSRAGKLATRVKLAFVPKQGRKLSKSLTVHFRR